MGPAFSLIFSKSIFCSGKIKLILYSKKFILDSFKIWMIGYISFISKKKNTFEDYMASKDGKIFDTIVYIGLSVNGLVAIYLLLMYFEVI